MKFIDNSSVAEQDRFTAKRFFCCALGGFGALFGVFWLFILVLNAVVRHNHLQQPAAFVSFFFFALFLLFVGIRGLAYAARFDMPAFFRLPLGRVLFGAFLLFNLVAQELHPSPGLLKPDNAAQAFGMLVAKIAFFAAAVILIANGIRKSSQSGNVQSSSPIAPQS